LPDAIRPAGWPEGFVRNRADRDALLVLAHLRSKTPRELHELAWKEGSASDCLRAVRRGAASPGDRAVAERVDPGVVLRRLAMLDARAVTPADPEYPERLLALSDPPAMLFVRGLPLTGLDAAVAIVGARNCSAYGRDAAISLASGLATAGVAVVSGAAIGVDGAAHEGALMGAGYTVAVLGSSLDRPYPRTNEELIGRIAAEGTVVTEYPPRTAPYPRHFPQRNRIIAALSDGVIVVEGAAGSGSLQTAEHAYEELNRELMAVPGPIDSPLSQAPHDLIRNGAALVADANDVLAALGLLELVQDPASPSAVEGDEGRVLATLSGRPISLEDIAGVSGLRLDRALVALSGLELGGRAESVGGRYRLTAQPRRECQTSSEPVSATRAISAEGA
jgi:DNA processing protein